MAFHAAQSFLKPVLTLPQNLGGSDFFASKPSCRLLLGKLTPDTKLVKSKCLHKGEKQLTHCHWQYYSMNSIHSTHLHKQCDTNTTTASCGTTHSHTHTHQHKWCDTNTTTTSCDTTLLSWTKGESRLMLSILLLCTSSSLVADTSSSLLTSSWH